MEKSYYGVQRTDEYLAHYGIKGMKWGVHKARESGNTKALSRQYAKAQKKLAKLEKRAASGQKYAKRAAALGAGAAVAGGLAAAGTTKIASAIGQGGMRAATAGNNLGKAMVTLGGSKKFRKGKLGSAMRTAGYNLQNSTAGIRTGAGQLAGRINKWGGSGSGIQTKAGRALQKQGEQNVAAATKVFHAGKLTTADFNAARKVGYGDIAKGKKMQFTNNQLARAGAAAVGAGLLGAAGYNAYRAATTKRAAKKAAQFRSEMNKAFAGTQYASKPRQGKKRQARG